MFANGAYWCYNVCGFLRPFSNGTRGDERIARGFAPLFIAFIRSPGPPWTRRQRAGAAGDA